MTMYFYKFDLSKTKEYVSPPKYLILHRNIVQFIFKYIVHKKLYCHGYYGKWTKLGQNRLVLKIKVALLMKLGLHYKYPEQIPCV